MPATSNSLEGLTSGTGVTTGNSGGLSGNAFDVMTLGSGATATADNTHSAHGVVSMKLATGGSAADCVAEWTTKIGSTTTLFVRMYVWIPSNPAANHRLFDIVANPNLCGALYLTSTGKVEAVDTGGGQMTITATSVALSQWVRIEAKYTASATVGQAEVRLFNSADSIVPTEVKLSAASFNTQASFNEYRFGAAGDPLPANRTLWYDDIALSTVDWVGPVATDPNPIWTPGFMAANSFPSFMLSIPQDDWPAASPYDTGLVAATGPVTVNPALETETGQPLGRIKTKAIGTAVETGTAVTVTPNKSRTLGVAVETDAVVAVGRLKTRAVGITAGTDAAQPLGRRKSLLLGVTLETDQTVTIVRFIPALGIALETDTAQPIGRRKVKLLGVAVETDASQLLVGRKTKALAFAAETESAVTLTRVHKRTLGVGLEPDTSISFGRRKRQTASFVVEVDEAVLFTLPAIFGTAVPASMTVPQAASATAVAPAAAVAIGSTPRASSATGSAPTATGG